MSKNDGPVFLHWSSFSQQPVFPATITIGDTTVTMRTDGTWDGDPDFLESEMANKRGGLAGEVAALLWLILREMRRDRADAAAVERLRAMNAAWDADRT